MAKASPSNTPGILGMVRVMTVLLLIQFLSGIYTNLFITLPRIPETRQLGGPFASMGSMMSEGIRDPVFLAHMIMGPLLVLGALITLILAIMGRFRPAIILSSLGLVFVLAAGFGGLTFYMDGQHNDASFIMALGWLSALTTYFIAWGVTSDMKR
ncbi:MAG: hypothetical protein M1294_05645 [Firmicutes bacterium]|nr:hypothetical protein [Bacillota bacterium]MCL5013055.1 hypothetical protein [Bacillota bacterium]HBQ95194.1 hypothetical protein [Sulfobacillus sp.]